MCKHNFMSANLMITLVSNAVVPNFGHYFIYKSPSWCCNPLEPRSTLAIVPLLRKPAPYCRSQRGKVFWWIFPKLFGLMVGLLIYPYVTHSGHTLNRQATQLMVAFVSSKSQLRELGWLNVYSYKDHFSRMEPLKLRVLTGNIQQQID